jgi:DNA-binding HxlR family transcriptional regulator
MTVSKLTRISTATQKDVAIVESILGPENPRISRKDVCSVIKAIRTIGSEWRVLLVYYLLDGPLRFNELLRRGELDSLNSRTLSRTLKYLQRQGIVGRRVVGTEPFSVVYELTPKGQDMAGILSAYRLWGEKWTPNIMHPLPYPKTLSKGSQNVVSSNYHCFPTDPGRSKA